MPSALGLTEGATEAEAVRIVLEQGSHGGTPAERHVDKNNPSHGLAEEAPASRRQGRCRRVAAPLHGAGLRKHGMAAGDAAGAPGLQGRRGEERRLRTVALEPRLEVALLRGKRGQIGRARGEAK